MVRCTSAQVLGFPHFKLTNILKFGEGDGPNLCRVKKVDFSSTFFENIFRSGLTLVSFEIVSVTKIKNKLIYLRYSILRDFYRF